ncbi:MAG: hypothetical protein ABSA75_11100 [Candidatus Bathyarchaeia archaeon]
MKKLQILIIAFLLLLSICALASIQSKAEGTAVSITVSPATDAITAGNPETYRATATDACGYSWDVTDSVTWSISCGAGGSWSNNVYTSATAGSWTVTAYDGSCVTGTASLTVTPGPLAQFEFSAISSPQTAGTSSSVTITAVDSCGNTVTNYSGTPALSDTSGTISPTITGDLVGGVWTGSVTVIQAGSDVITATDISGAIGSSASFMVDPAGLNHFVFGAISSSQTAGSAFGITVTAVDAYGNTATSYSSTLSLTYSAGSINPGAMNAFVNGVGSTSVTVTTAGSSVTLGVNDGIGHTGTSNPFTVSHATSVSEAVSPGSATISAGNSETYAAKASDAYGNIWDVTSSTNWSISSGAGGSWNGNVYTSATAGSWTVTGTYASTAYTAGLTVNPAGLDHFIFNNVATQTTGTPFSITVTAKDAYDNTATSYTGTPSLTYSAGSINPGAMNAFIKGAGSTAVTVTTAGLSITITATDGTHTGESNSFTVIATQTSTPTPTPTHTPTPTTSTPSPTATPISTSTPTSTATPPPTPTATLTLAPGSTPKPTTTPTATPTSTAKPSPTPTPSSTKPAAPLLGLTLSAIATGAAIILILTLIAIKRRKRKHTNKLPEIVDLKNSIKKIKNLEVEKKNLLREVEQLKKKVEAKAAA